MNEPNNNIVKIG